MKNVEKKEFAEMTAVEQGMVLLSYGKHLSQVNRGGFLQNLYSINNFFVEVYYSLTTNEIDKIEIVNDLSRIDLYIDESQKEEKLHLN